MKHVKTLLLLSTMAFGQTLTDLKPVGGNLESPFVPNWCPGPVFEVLTPKMLVVGKNWTAAKPCIARFQVTPPAATDPAVIVKLTQPITVTLATAFTGNDDIYLYLTVPAAGVSSQTIAAQSKAGTIATCTGGCTGIQTQTVVPRQFPPMAMPIGFVPVLNGAFYEKGYDMISFQPVSLAQGVVGIVRRDQDGYTVRLESAGAGTPAAAALTGAMVTQQRSVAVQHQLNAAMTELRNETVRAQSATAAASRQNAMVRITDLEGRINDLFRELDRTRDKIPPNAEEMGKLRAEFYEISGHIEGWRRRMEETFGDIAMRANEMTSNAFELARVEAERGLHDFYRGMHRIGPPSEAEMKLPCQIGQKALDEKKKKQYECVAEKWVITDVREIRTPLPQSANTKGSQQTPRPPAR